MKKKLPSVALAGRKNVGKSSLLNTLLGKARAITDDYPGLTRDLIEVEIRRYGYHFHLIDMPGLDLDEEQPLEKEILRKVRGFLASVDCVVLVYAAPSPAPFDRELRELFRHQFPKIPIVEIVNMVDNPEMADNILPDFYEAGLFPVPVSAKSRWNMRALCKEIDDRLSGAAKDRARDDDPDREKDRPDGHTPIIKRDSTIVSDSETEDLRIALVGKPNVGKSSLFNRWIGKELSLVSDIPGTTRDTMDTVFRFFGHTVRVIDTAGLRRERRIKEAPEFFSARRTRRAIQDSHIVVQLISAVDGITDYDKKIAAMIQEYARPSIIVINKWDAVPERKSNTQKEFLADLQSLFPYLKKVPVFFCSALTGKRSVEPLKKAIELFERSSFRIPTARLNEIVQQWLSGRPGIPAGFKLRYVTQTGRMPPVFVLFVNQSRLLPESALSYLENRLREEFQLEGIPIRIFVRDHSEEKNVNRTDAAKKKHTTERMS
jgi:GTP-binding protein